MAQSNLIFVDFIRIYGAYSPRDRGVGFAPEIANQLVKSGVARLTPEKDIPKSSLSLHERQANLRRQQAQVQEAVAAVAEDAKGKAKDKVAQRG